MGKSRSAFSLVELLVVMAITGVLVALMVSGLGRAVENARVIQCLANLRAIGVGCAAFSADSDGKLPQSSHQGPAVAWQYVLPAYLDRSDRKVFKSPLGPNPTLAYSYAINDFVTQKPYGASHLDYSRRQSIDQPAQTMHFTLTSKSYGGTDHFHFADGEEAGYAPAAFSSQVHVNVAGGSGHYLFVDGHVERMRWQTLQSELTRNGSRFVNPAGHQNQ
jgi:prepilin-type N-terminal cleavage/methylation domain-containing protein/prepilin-type processing-associated H-X9-DG protein